MRYLFIIFFWVLIMAQPGYGQFVSVGLKGKIIHELKKEEGKLYAGANDGLYVRNLSAENPTWQSLGLEGRQVKSVLIFSPDTLLAGTWEGTEQDSVHLFRTTNGGSTWQPYQNGFGIDTARNSVVDLDMASSRGDTLFGIGDDNIFRSTDRGASWQQIEALGKPTNFIQANYADKRLVFTGAVSAFFIPHLLKTVDGGLNWSVSQSGKNAFHYTDFVYHPDKNSTAFVTEGNLIQKTMDSGEHWNTVLKMRNQDISAIDLSAKRDSIIYAGGWDEGSTWTGTTGDTLELFISSNGGLEWGVIRSHEQKKAKRINSIEIRGQANSELIYLGTDYGVYRYKYDLQPLSTLKPHVSIVSPADSARRFYIDQTTKTYRGIRLIVKGGDPDGTIQEFGWAVNGGSYNWTQQDTIMVPPSAFGSAGSHKIRVTARSEQGQTARPDTVQVTLIEPDFSKGILVVDDTDENDISKDWSTDAHVDSLYKDWLSPYRATHWDINEKGLPSRQVLGRYQLVFWHADNYYMVVSNAHRIGEHKEVLAGYMDVGGDLFLSGWNILKAIYPLLDNKYSFRKNSFAYSNLRIAVAAITGGGPPGNMVAAHGKNGFPDLSIDSSKTNGYPVSFYRYMTSVSIIKEGVADTTDRFQQIFTFQCRENCDIPKAEDKLIGFLYNGKTFQSTYLGFPLSFMDSRQAGKAVSQILADMGNYPTSLSRTDLPKKVRLSQNYPNPFNPSTKIRYALPQAANVTITVYDMLGRRVATLVNGKREAGRHTVTFNANNLSSGVYIYRLQTDSYSRSRKMLLIK